MSIDCSKGGLTRNSSGLLYFTRCIAVEYLHVGGWKVFSYDEEIIDETINVIKLLLKQVPVEEIAKKLKLPVEEVTKIRDKFNQ